MNVKQGLYMTQEIELVDVFSSTPQVEVDMKYATPDNITGQIIYSENRCLLHPDAASALMRCVEIAALANFTLLIYDA